MQCNAMLQCSANRVHVYILDQPLKKIKLPILKRFLKGAYGQPTLKIYSVQFYVLII